MTKRPIESIDQLGPQRRRVAELIAAGLTDKAIQGRLGITCATIRKHLYYLGQQVGVGAEEDTRTVVVLWVIRQKAA